MVISSKMWSVLFIMLGSYVSFISCDDDDPDFEQYYNTAVSTVAVIGIIAGVIAFIVIAVCIIVICCCCMRSSRNRGHVYRQPNTPMNYTAVTVPPPQQQMGYPAAPQAYPATTYPPAQGGMTQHTAYPPMTYPPQSGMVQHSTNVASGYPAAENKAEPTAPPADNHNGQGYPDNPSSGFEKPPPYPGY